MSFQKIMSLTNNNVINKGCTIRKVMGGGGEDFFNLYEYFYFFFACVDNFFKYNPLHEFLYFNL
jgi:hypothetical protein